jgi:threonine synthase
MLCPHSAVGVSALDQLDMVKDTSVALATAHEAKFPDAVKMAVNPLPEAPPELARLWKMKTRSQVCDNDLAAVEDFMRKRIRERLERGKAVVQYGKWVLGGAFVAAVLGVVAVAVTRRKR